MSSKLQQSVNEVKPISSEPEYITAECVRQKKMANAASLAAAQQINNFNVNNNNHGKCEIILNVGLHLINIYIS